MSKITLTDVKGGFNLTAIQSNFDALETELQGKVFYRNNPVGEPNTMETDVDMNNKRILNLPEPISDNEPLRKRDAGSLSSLIASAAGYASTASIKAAEATASASSASGSAASATASASAASASAIAAAASAVAAEDSSRLTVGTTTTGAAGSSASVTITGSPGAQALNLTIPRGDTGATGAAGAGITPQAVGFTLTGGTTPKTLTVALDANVSGTNTGDQTSVTGNAGTVTNGVYTTDKDASGGVPGLTLFKLNLRNAANTITSWFTTAATVARTWTLPDKDGTVAMTSDITGGTQAGSFTTLNTSSNVVLGDATTDTLNVGNGGLIKDASGNVGLGRNPNYALDVYKSGTSNSVIAAANDNVVTVMQTVTNIQANVGTLTSHPVVFIQGNTEAARIDTNKNLLVTTPALLGYGTGAGGTVTQATSKTTAVTLNKPCGKITMHNAALAAGSTVLFTFTNSLIGAADIVNLQLDVSGIASTADYNVWASVSSGSAIVALKNVSVGSLSESVGIRFAVIKVAQS